ncbi:MAG: hypothetical protein R6U22_06210 [Desulfohalobiaceae bacterium]
MPAQPWTAEVGPQARQGLGWVCSYTPRELILAAGFASQRLLNRGGPGARFPC